MEENKKIRLTIGISSFILVCTITLFLLGYSAALAIETVFGIPAKITYSSTLELLHLSSLVFSGWLEIINSKIFIDSIKKLTIQTLIIGIIVSLAVFTINIIFKKIQKSKNQQKKTEEKSILSKAIQWINKEKLTFIPIAIGALLPSAILFLMTVTIISFTIIPIMGFSAAKKHLQSWQIEPEYCAPLINRENRIKNNKTTKKENNEKTERITPCLSIWKNGTMIAEGRYITSTETHISIFNPKTGDVSIEPINGVSIRVSGDEEINQKQTKEE